VASSKESLPQKRGCGPEDLLSREMLEKRNRENCTICPALFYLRERSSPIKSSGGWPKIDSRFCVPSAEYNKIVSKQVVGVV